MPQRTSKQMNKPSSKQGKRQPNKKHTKMTREEKKSIAQVCQATPANGLDESAESRNSDSQEWLVGRRGISLSFPVTSGGRVCEKGCWETDERTDSPMEVGVSRWARERIQSPGWPPGIMTSPPTQGTGNIAEDTLKTLVKRPETRYSSKNSWALPCLASGYHAPKHSVGCKITAFKLLREKK